MTEIFVAEEHVQVYELWRQRGDRGLRLCHVDFHCDMRGLLIDRRRRTARPVKALDPQAIDSGNFLAHAVLQGIVTKVRWVHDQVGGRRYDSGTVKYEADPSGLARRLVHWFRGAAEVPLEFEELTFERWDGLESGEQLDIDWDGLASVHYERSKIRRLMSEVLDREFRSPPSSIYVAYSPGYSNPDRALFEEFLDRLQRKFAARLTRCPPHAGPPHPPAPVSGRRTIGHRVILALNRLGIH